MWSGGRALSSLISKCNVNRNFNYYIFKQFSYTCVSCVLLYAGETCGFNKCDQIQHRAMCFLLSIHKCAPIPRFQRDMVWVPL